MRDRGKVYWEWADASLHCRSIDERQPDGTLFNIQVRMSLLGRTQLFIGVYDIKGKMLLEEAFDSMVGQTMTSAMAWGLERARLNSPISVVTPKPAKPHPLPRPGSRRGK